jgi:hypothetical protein
MSWNRRNDLWKDVQKRIFIKVVIRDRSTRTGFLSHPPITIFIIFFTCSTIAGNHGIFLSSGPAINIGRSGTNCSLKQHSNPAVVMDCWTARAVRVTEKELARLRGGEFILFGNGTKILKFLHLI